MFIKDLTDCKEIIAGDNSILREILRPSNDIAVRYSIAHAVVKPGDRTLAHRLTTTEVYYILEGMGNMFINDESEKVHAGQAIYIPPLAKQYIKNSGTVDLKFLCIVDPAWRAGDEEIV